MPLSGWSKHDEDEQNRGAEVRCELVDGLKQGSLIVFAKQNIFQNIHDSDILVIKFILLVNIVKKETIYDRAYLFIEYLNRKSGSVQPSVISSSVIENIQNQTAIKDKKLDPELLICMSINLKLTISREMLLSSRSKWLWTKQNRCIYVLWEPIKGLEKRSMMSFRRNRPWCHD